VHRVPVNTKIEMHAGAALVLAGLGANEKPVRRGGDHYRLVGGVGGIRRTDV